MNISRCLYDYNKMFKSNMESILLNICLILGIIHVSSAQQPSLVGLESVIQAYVKAEVSKQLKCMRNDFSLLISLLQSEDKAQMNIFH